MQSLLVEAMRHSVHISVPENAERVKRCLELMHAIEAKKPKIEQRYALCRYNESLVTHEIADSSISEEIERRGDSGYWSHVRHMARTELEVYDDEVIIEELLGSNAIWWEEDDHTCITFLPPRPLSTEDLEVRLICREGNYSVVDADGDENPCERDEAHLVLSLACEKRKGGYPLLSYCVEGVESSL
nr:hypothetical protein [Marseillevirus cajuinensis]